MANSGADCGCGGEGNLPRVARHGRWVWHVTAAADDDAALAQLLRDPDGALDAPPAEVHVLKRDRGTSVAVVGQPGRWVIKRYNFAKALNPVKDVFRKSAAERAFRMARALEQADVATARAVAVGVRRWLGVPICSCVISSYLAGTRCLMEILPDGPSDAVLEAVARLLAKLHDGGFSCRDLKANNILVREGSEGDEDGAEAYLVDLDGLRQMQEVGRALREKNLARLQRSLLEWPKAGRRAWDVFVKYYEQYAG